LGGWTQIQDLSSAELPTLSAKVPPVHHYLLILIVMLIVLVIVLVVGVVVLVVGVFLLRARTPPPNIG